MKKTYETPNAEKISFEYQEQVVASNAGNNCISTWINTGAEYCADDNKFQQKIQN